MENGLGWLLRQIVWVQRDISRVVISGSDRISQLLIAERFMVQATESIYMVRDDQILQGEPIVAGTRTPMRAIIETWRLEVTPEEIPKGMPHLTMGQVFGALAYYSDHQDEINRYLEQNRIPMS